MAIRTDDRLIQLKNGVWIDVRHINLLQAVANAKPYVGGDGRSHGASVIIETRHAQYRVPMLSFRDAEQYRDTLAALANHRGRKPETRNGVDWTGYEEAHAQ